MNIPEGYAQAPTGDDHLMKIAVPVPGRDPILIEAPKAGWVTPAAAEAVQKWIDPIVAAEQEVDEWHEANDDLPEDERTPFPTAAAKKCGDGDKEKSRLLTREAKIRWLKPHMSDADYKTLLTSKDISERTISWIADQATSPDITPGESAASSDS